MKKLLTLTLLSTSMFVGYQLRADQTQVDDAFNTWKHADDYLNIEYADKKARLSGQAKADFEAQQSAWLNKRIRRYGNPDTQNITTAGYVNMKRATVGRLLDIKNNRNDVEAFDFNDQDNDFSLQSSDAQADWKRADRILNIDYKALEALHSGGALQALQRNQIAWHNKIMASWGNPEVNTPDENLAWKFSNLETVTLARLLYLKAYTGDRVVIGLEGEYTDSLGGWLSLTKNGNGTFSANLFVARGQSGANGQQSATVNVAPSKEGNGSDSGTLVLNGGCTVSFSRVNHAITLTERPGTCGADHGFGASFSGIYLKDTFKALQ